MPYALLAPLARLAGSARCPRPAHGLLSSRVMPACRPRHRAIPWVFAALSCGGSVTGCASRVGFEDGGALDARSDARHPLVDDGGDAADGPRLRDVPITYDVYREDACAPEAGMGVRMYTCDPFNPYVGCPAGEACYPFIDYPDGPCGREVYRAECRPVGTVPMDGFCGGGAEGTCAPGLTCFVTGAGNRCLTLCRIDGSGAPCPRGQVCEPTDLPDFGACD